MRCLFFMILICFYTHSVTAITQLEELSKSAKVVSITSADGSCDDATLYISEQDASNANTTNKNVLTIQKTTSHSTQEIEAPRDGLLQSLIKQEFSGSNFCLFFTELQFLPSFTMPSISCVRIYSSAVPYFDLLTCFPNLKTCFILKKDAPIVWMPSLLDTNVCIQCGDKDLSSYNKMVDDLSHCEAEVFWKIFFAKSAKEESTALSMMQYVGDSQGLWTIGSFNYFSRNFFSSRLPIYGLPSSLKRAMVLETLLDKNSFNTEEHFALVYRTKDRNKVSWGIHQEIKVYPFWNTADGVVTVSPTSESKFSPDWFDAYVEWRWEEDKAEKPFFRVGPVKVDGQDIPIFSHRVSVTGTILTLLALGKFCQEIKSFLDADSLGAATETLSLKESSDKGSDEPGPAY